MFEFLGDAAAAILTGGATGLLGTALSFVSDYFTARQKHEQEMDLRRLDIELAKTEAAGLERAALVEADSAREQAEWSALEASYREAMRRWSWPGDGWALAAVDVVRGLLRPTLTVGFLALTAALYFSAAAHAPMQERIVETVLYLTATTVLWWFGGRQVDKARSRGAR